MFRKIFRIKLASESETVSCSLILIHSISELFSCDLVSSN